MTTPSESYRKDATPALAVDLDVANEYFANRLHDKIWDEVDPTLQSQALAAAAEILDASCVFLPTALERDDASGELRWRQPVVAALCEEALWLLQRRVGPFARFDATAIRRAAVAGIDATFDRTRSDQLVAPIAKRLLLRYARLQLNDDGGDIVATPLAI